MLKFAFTVAGLLIACPVISQKISFKYDEAGNRILRSAESALPVRLADFTVATEAGSVIIAWKTAGGENFSHFELERSTDGRSWQHIAKVRNRESEESLSTVTYRHTDRHPAAGLNIYRLRMVDDDGTAVYSKLESVFLESEMRVYPNPARNYLVVDYAFQAEASYAIFTPDGRVVLRGRLLREKRIDLGTLAPAVYIIRFTLASGQILTRRIVKE